jgi:hypothetical protein
VRLFDFCKFAFVNLTIKEVARFASAQTDLSSV